MKRQDDGIFDLTDKEWQRIGPICLSGRGKNGHPSDTRLFVDAVLYILGGGTPWRDLPSDYGNWHTIYVRYMDWCRRGIWMGKTIC
ncbi:MAG: transposase [Solidesulfovibrio sp. DCME]|uniref:transposase n=1 Tax=Solidesulfovibrio sp. DCME TaxID=3447380 RepID=UPI003D131207